jgi:hypothetical protein
VLDLGLWFLLMRFPMPFFEGRRNGSLFGMPTVHAAEWHMVAEMSAYQDAEWQQDEEAKQEGGGTKKEREKQEAWKKTAMESGDRRSCRGNDCCACRSLRNSRLERDDSNGDNSDQQDEAGDNTENPKVFHGIYLTNKIGFIVHYKYGEPMDKKRQYSVE